MTSEVILYTSDETGAPALNHSAGSFVALLDALLVDGFNSKTIVSAAVASNVCTLTISAHGYTDGRKLLIAGLSAAGCNGVKKISIVDGNTVSYATTGVADGAIGGAGTAKRAPLGWSKLYTAANQRVYKRNDPAATTMLLRVDDTATGTLVNLTSVETATDVNTYTAPCPAAGGTNWSKGPDDGSAKPWIIVGDGMGFHYVGQDPGGDPLSNGALAYYFGDLVPFRVGDAYHCIITGKSGTTGDSQDPPWFRASSYTLAIGNMTAQRGAFQIGTPVSLAVIGAPTGGGFKAFGADPNPTFPSAVDNGLVFTDKVLALEANNFRGYVPGLKEPLATVPAALHGAIIIGLEDTDHQVMLARVQTYGGVGAIGLDVSGPWS